MKRIYLIAILFALCSFKMPNDEYVTINYEKDGKPIKLINDNYSLIITTSEGIQIPVIRNNNQFKVSDFKNKELVDVTFIYKKTKYLFKNVSVKKFDGVWLLGEDRKPFDEEIVQLSGTSSKKIKYYYYIKFEPLKGDGTNMVVSVSK